MKMLKPQNVDSYIADSVSEAHQILDEIRELIKSTVPEAEEGISYSVAFYKYYGEFVGFATYKNHVSFGFGADVLQSQDRDTLTNNGYTLGKGTLQIKFNQKVPVTEIKKILTQKSKMNEIKGVK